MTPPAPAPAPAPAPDLDPEHAPSPNVSSSSLSPTRSPSPRPSSPSPFPLKPARKALLEESVTHKLESPFVVDKEPKLFLWGQCAAEVVTWLRHAVNRSKYPYIFIHPDFPLLTPRFPRQLRYVTQRLSHPPSPPYRRLPFR